MRTLAQQATVLKHAVVQTARDLGDTDVPVEYRLREAREALEALGQLADTVLRREIARSAEPRRRTPRSRGRVH